MLAAAESDLVVAARLEDERVVHGVSEVVSSTDVGEGLPQGDTLRLLPEREKT